MQRIRTSYTPRLSKPRTLHVYCFPNYYTIIDFNEVDIRIYLPEKVIIHRGR